MIKEIKSLALKYDLGNLIDLEILNSSQNKVYKVTTDKSTYVIKKYTKDAIQSYYYLKKRKEQIRISEILNQNGIKTIAPLAHYNKYFICYHHTYYLVYNYFDNKPKEYCELTLDNIQKLAITQAKIHKLKIASSLPCSYRYIKIDIDKQIKKIKHINKKLYDVLAQNQEKLKQIIKNANKSLKQMRKNLCISHNDYKLLNILWNKEEPILIDFDATGLSNPTCSLCESAFTFSYNNHDINYEYYKNYLKAYISEYGKTKDDYLDSLYTSFNGKLQWLKYMFSKNHLKKDNYIEGSISMIKELNMYYDNIDKFYQIYLEVIGELERK